MLCTWFSWTLSVLTLKLFKGTVSLGVREQLKPAKNAATLLSLHSLIHCTTKRAENDGARESALLLRSSHSLTRSSDRPTGVGLRRTDKWRAGHQSNRRRREAPKLKSPCSLFGPTLSLSRNSQMAIRGWHTPRETQFHFGAKPNLLLRIR